MFLKNTEITKILNSSCTGIWKIETEEGNVPRLYADQTMMELIGGSEDMTPEELFAFHRKHIHPEDVELFERYAERISMEATEIVYRYIHPEQGEMYVRCSGKPDFTSRERTVVSGFHQCITDTIRLEKSSETLKHITEQNVMLKRRETLQNDFYRDLLDVQACGLMAYTLPEHKILHMNVEALRMYGFDSIEEVQNNFFNIIRNFYYPDPDTPKH